MRSLDYHQMMTLGALPESRFHAANEKSVLHMVHKSPIRSQRTILIARLLNSEASEQTVATNRSPPFLESLVVQAQN